MVTRNRSSIEIYFRQVRTFPVFNNEIEVKYFNQINQLETKILQELLLYQPTADQVEDYIIGLIQSDPRLEEDKKQKLLTLKELTYQLRETPDPRVDENLSKLILNDFPRFTKFKPIDYIIQEYSSRKSTTTGEYTSGMLASLGSISDPALPN